MEQGNVKLYITYCNMSKGIFGLSISPSYKAFGRKFYRVTEDMSPDRDLRKRKTVYEGSLGGCRYYICKRFNS